MKKTLSIMIGLVMATTLLAGCGSSSSSSSASSDGTNKLSGKIVFSTHRTDHVDDTLKKLATDFMAKNPGTTIEVEGIKDPDTTIKTRMAADEMPDIVQILTTVKKADYPKYYASIDDLGYSADNMSFYDQAKSTDGKHYGISYGLTYAGGVTYNKAVFKKAGIDKVPTTMDEFYADCAKIKALGVVPFATNFKDKWPLETYKVGYGAYKTGDVGYMNTLSKQDKLIDGVGEDGMKFIRTMKEKSYVEPDLMSTNWDGFKKDMAQGKVAMAMLGSWVNPQIVENGANQADIGFFMFPDFKTTITGADTFYAVAAHSKNLPLAKAFFKYINDEGRYAVATGMIPCNKNVTNLPDYVKSITENNPPAKEGVAQADEVTALLNKTQIDLATVVQEYVMAKDPQTVVKKYNDMWAAARK
jgi:raffinose/stachyose/melibiose transport system substrate-binding protein